MKKIAAIVALIIVESLCMQQAVAQLPLPVPAIKPTVTLGASLVYSMPQSDFKDAYKYGLGGEVFGGIGWGSTLVIATVGASAFSAETNNNSGTLTYVPVRVGVKKFFLLKRLFINGDLGVASVKNKDFKESAFTIGAGAGVRLLGLELGLYYNTFKVKEMKRANTLNAKAGFSFSF